MRRKPCKGCGSTTRKTPHPGPRCATCHRGECARRRLAAFDLYLRKNYGITLVEYEAIKAAQGGRCAWCVRATGASKALAVDHCHTLARLHDHPVDKGCRMCVRGLLCGTCNKIVGHFRDDPAAIRRGALYVESPPALAVLPRLVSSAA